MQVFYAPHRPRSQSNSLWPLLGLPLFIAVIIIMLTDNNLLDENDRPYTPGHHAFIIIFSILLSVILIVAVVNVSRSRKYEAAPAVVLRIGNGEISCFESIPALFRRMPFSSLAGFTFYIEQQMVKDATGCMMNISQRYVVLHFRQPNCAWMIPEQSFQDINLLINFFRSIRVPEVPFARNMYPNGALYIPVNY